MASGTIMRTGIGTDWMKLSGRFLSKRAVRKKPMPITASCIGKPTAWKNGMPSLPNAPREKSANHRAERVVRIVATKMGHGHAFKTRSKFIDEGRGEAHRED